MKAFKTIILIITLCFATNTEAQLLKKLGKKVEKAAEKTIEKKIEEKTERETEKAFDSTFNNSKKNKKNKKKSGSYGSSKASPASSYQFSHRYVMEINDGKRPLDMVYYLNRTGNYLATEIPDQKSKTITVIDMEKDAMFMFMDDKGRKSQMSMKMNLQKVTDDAIAETNYSVKATGNTKTILNYLCKEYEVKGNDMYGTVWVTEQASVSFSKVFYQTKQKKGIDQTWMSKVNGLPLEMTITDTSKRKPKTMTMHCKSLDAKNFTIDTSHYKKLM